MAVNIVLSVAGQGSGSGGESREFAYSVVNPTAPLVTLSLDNVTGITSYLWEILNQPPGASSSLSSDSAASPTFTPTDSTWGTYLLRCTIIRSSVQEVGTIALSFKTPIRDMRFPAAGEKVEFDVGNGWMLAEHVLWEIVDGLTANSYWDRTGTILSPDTAGDTLQLSSGTAAIPSSAYVSDDNTGRYLHATGIEGFSVGGTAQLLFGNDGNPFIKAADGHQYLKIGNYKTTSGGASQIVVEAVGATANPGGILDLKATATSTKAAYVNIDSDSVSGPSGVYIQSDSGSSISSSSTAQLKAIGEGPTTVNIESNTTVNDVDSLINILATSAVGDSTITIGVNAAGTGSVYYGNQYTDSLRIADKSLEDSSVTWKFLEVASASSQWETLDINFGNITLVEMLNSLASASLVSVHNNTTGKQGGTTGEYYHLTSANYIDLITNLPIGNGAIVFGNSGGELDHDVASLYWLAGATATALFELEGATSSQVTHKALSPDGAASLYIYADSADTSGGSSTIGIRTYANDGGCELELTDIFKYSIDNKSILEIDEYADSSNDAVIYIPDDASNDRDLHIINSQSGGEGNIYLTAATSLAATPSEVIISNESLTTCLIHEYANADTTGSANFRHTARNTDTKRVLVDGYADTGGLTQYVVKTENTDDTNGVYINLDNEGGASNNAAISILSHVNGSGLASSYIKSKDDASGNYSSLDLVAQAGQDTTATLLAYSDFSTPIIDSIATVKAYSNNYAAKVFITAEGPGGYIYLQAGVGRTVGHVYLEDQPMNGSSITGPINIGANAIAEWNQYDSNFGEVSYVNALNQLASGGGSEPSGQIVYGTGSGVTSEADLIWNPSTNILTSAGGVVSKYYGYSTAPQSVTDTSGSGTLTIDFETNAFVIASIEANVTTFTLGTPTYCMHGVIRVTNTDTSDHTIAQPSNGVFIAPESTPITVVASGWKYLSCDYWGSTYGWKISAIEEA